MLTFATEAMISGDAKQRLTDLPILLLDAPIASRAELDFIRSTSLRTRDILATAPTADERTVAHLRDELGLEVENLDALSNAEFDRGTRSIGSLSSLQRHLFNENITAGAAQPDGQVLVFSAPGESRECVEIARRILALARDGIDFDQIAVLLRAPEQYRAHLEEAFSRAGIPAHFARGAVRPDPAGRAFYSLLRCAAEGISARRFAEYLSLGQVPIATSDAVGGTAQFGLPYERCVRHEPRSDQSNSVQSKRKPRKRSRGDKRKSGQSICLKGTLRDHLWQGPPLPVTLRLIHPPPKMTQGVMTPLTPFITFNSILERGRKVLA